MSTSYNISRKKPDYVHIELEQIHPELLRIKLKITQQTSRIMNDIERLINECLNNHQCDLFDDASQETTCGADSSVIDVLKIEVSTPKVKGKEIDVSGIIKIDTIDILQKIRDLLFTALCQNEDINTDHGLLGRLFWLSEADLADQLEQARDWNPILHALRNKNMREVYDLLGDAPLNENLLEFIYNNRPSNAELKENNKEWKEANGEQLVLKICIYLANIQLDKKPSETVSEVIATAEQLLQSYL